MGYHNIRKKQNKQSKAKKFKLLSERISVARLEKREELEKNIGATVYSEIFISRNKKSKCFIYGGDIRINRSFPENSFINYELHNDPCEFKTLKERGRTLLGGTPKMSNLRNQDLITKNSSKNLLVEKYYRNIKI